LETRALTAHTHWSRSFSLSPADIEALISVLLERETPLPTSELARILISARLEADAKALAERFSDVLPYHPADSYKVGQRLVFTSEALTTGTVKAIHDANNPDQGAFKVMDVALEDGTIAQYASGLTGEHSLNEAGIDGMATEEGEAPLTVEQIFDESGEQIFDTLDDALVGDESLVRLAGKWFPRDLLMEINEGHINLAEAVLELNEGEPLRTPEILDQMGGVGDAPLSLQEFSLNYNMNLDDRFDEVGPAGEVMWFLRRQEPPEVRETPALLRYTPIEVDRSLLTQDMLRLEHDLDDELSPLETVSNIRNAVITLIYPHRRLGSLPLNAHARALFPTARRAPRIAITLVDGTDGEEFPGWVVHDEGFVFGLAPFYRKHTLPLGAQVTVLKGKNLGRIGLDFPDSPSRTEYVPLFHVKDGQPSFDLQTRPLTVPYDDLMVMGIDDLKAVEQLAQDYTKQRKTMAGILKILIGALVRLSPQGTAHAKTIYSALNVVRRCPPGVMLATLNANPDFENVGGHYWKLSDV
jgi:hypothetical protein